jgi:hypothetical protein
MPFYHKGDVRIRYEEAGTGFPLLVTPGGGLNSRVSNWATAVFNAMGRTNELPESRQPVIRQVLARNLKVPREKRYI